jgi:hypothetical protein
VPLKPEDRDNHSVGSFPVGSCRNLSKLGRASRLPRSRGAGRGAPELGLQLDEVGEDVGLAAQLVDDHRRLAGDHRGDHGETLALGFCPAFCN